MTFILLTLKYFSLWVLMWIAFVVALAVVVWPIGLLTRRLKIAERRRSRPPGTLSDGSIIRARMKRMATTTLLMVPAEAPGFSKLGGLPELPADVGWPDGDEGVRVFLAQLDLAAVRGAGGPDWLPAEGWLYAFYDPERHGCADVVSIIYSVEPPGEAIAPSTTLAAKWRFPERRVGFQSLPSIPSLEWLGLDVRELDLDGHELDELADAHDAALIGHRQHRIGGYPSEIQETQMAMDCEYLARGLPHPAFGADVAPALKTAAKTWRLLLQIDSDPGLKMNWGDGGMLYVFIRQKHAQAADFAKTIAIWQTY